MGDAEELRARASRLFAFALSAHDLGIGGYAIALEPVGKGHLG
jgi:hypothetical protein